MWELDCEESWAPKNWCFWTVVLEKTLVGPLDCKEIQPVHPKGDQFWVFIGRTDVEAETSILWPSNVKIWLIWKDPDAGKGRGYEEKGTTEGERVGWHHRLNGHEFGWTSRVGDGQGGLAFCSPRGCKELDMAEWLKWTEWKKEKEKKRRYLLEWWVQVSFSNCLFNLCSYGSPHGQKDCFSYPQSLNAFQVAVGSCSKVRGLFSPRKMCSLPLILEIYKITTDFILRYTLKDFVLLRHGNKHLTRPHILEAILKYNFRYDFFRVHFQKIANNYKYLQQNNVFYGMNFLRSHFLLVNPSNRAELKHHHPSKWINVKTKAKLRKKTSVVIWMQISGWGSGITLTQLGRICRSRINQFL